MLSSKNIFPVLLLLCFSTNLIAQKIYRVAGTPGTDGSTGDGGPAISALLNTPQGVFVDSIGNIYIGDFYNSAVRKIDAKTGIITTIAGKLDSFGYRGDGGPATSALLNAVTKIGLDRSHNLYICDYLNNKVRKVSPSGIIDSFNVGASVINAAYLICDDTGNVYITEQAVGRVRKVSTTGAVTYIAGTGTWGYSGDGGRADTAKLYGPWGTAIDKAGNVYICDQKNQRIRKIDAATGIIHTIAGTGVNGYDGDSMPALSTRLYDPIALALDKKGNIYFSDLYNYRIRRIDAVTGLVTNVAGTGIMGYNGDGILAKDARVQYVADLALDRSGNYLYVCDMNNESIRLIVLCPAHINDHPINDSINAGDPAVFYVAADTTSSGSYQWQENRGTGFVNLSNGGIYSGVNTDTLHINPAAASMKNYQYRCVRIIGTCTDTSYAASIVMPQDNAIAFVETGDYIHVVPDPFTTSARLILDMQVELPCDLQIYDITGRQVLQQQNIANSEIVINKNEIGTGMFFIKLRDRNSKMYVTKIVAQ